MTNRSRSPKCLPVQIFPGGLLAMPPITLMKHHHFSYAGQASTHLSCSGDSAETKTMQAWLNSGF